MEAITNAIYIFICVLLTLALDLEYDLDLTFQLAASFKTFNFVIYLKDKADFYKT